MGEAYFENIKKELVEALKNAQSEIRIAVAWFTNQELFDTLICCLDRKVRISLLIVDDYINNGNHGLDFQSFIDKGGQLMYSKEDRPIHHKFCIIDNSFLFTGSYNWTYFAENKNLENVIKIDDSTIIERYIKEFDDLKMQLGVKTSANKISLEDINSFLMKDYVGLDLFYRGKETSNRKYIEDAEMLLPDNDEIKKELTSFCILTKKEHSISTIGLEEIIPSDSKKYRITNIELKQARNGNKYAVIESYPISDTYYTMYDLKGGFKNNTKEKTLCPSFLKKKETDNIFYKEEQHNNFEEVIAKGIEAGGIDCLNLFIVKKEFSVKMPPFRWENQKDNAIIHEEIKVNILIQDGKPVKDPQNEADRQINEFGILIQNI